MNPDNLSRRQLFGGLFAALFGWLFVGRKEALATPMPLAPGPAPATSGGRMTTVTTYVYDANNERVGKPVSRQVSAPATACTCEFDGHVITFTCREVEP